jgi:hypothetical protein
MGLPLRRLPGCGHERAGPLPSANPEVRSAEGSPVSTRRTLVGLLVATLAATAWVAWQGDDEAADLAVAGRAPSDAEPTVARQPAARMRRDAPAIDVVLPWPTPLAARPAADWGFEPARARAWVPPPPPPPAPPPRAPVVVATAGAASAPPQAPAFPYQLIGRVEEAGVAHALLAAPGRTLGVRASDVLDGQWRIDAVDAQGLALTWLPGGQRLQVPFRSS